MPIVTFTPHPTCYHVSASSVPTEGLHLETGDVVRIVDAACQERHIGPSPWWGAYFGVADKFVLPSTASSVVHDDSLNLTAGTLVLEPQIKSSRTGFWSKEAQRFPDPPGRCRGLLQARGLLITKQRPVILGVLSIAWIVGVIAVQGDKIIGTGASVSALGESVVQVKENLICFLVVDELREDPVVLLTAASE